MADPGDPPGTVLGNFVVAVLKLACDVSDHARIGLVFV
jgi:hypothetical protein